MPTPDKEYQLNEKEQELTELKDILKSEQKRCESLQSQNNELIRENQRLEFLNDQLKKGTVRLTPAKSLSQNLKKEAPIEHFTLENAFKVWEVPRAVNYPNFSSLVGNGYDTQE